MAVNPLENLPKLPQAPVAPKAPQAPAQDAAPKVQPVAAKPKAAAPRVINVKAEGLRQSRADQVIITARKDQGKFGHVQPAHTKAPAPAPQAAPGQPKAAAKRHAINIVG